MGDYPADEQLLETILLTASRPLKLDEIASRMPEGADTGTALERLMADYDKRSLTITETPEGWAVRTRAEHSDLCRKLLPKIPRLSKAALETLAVIACFQPVTRSEIEKVRGVALAKGTLDLLVWLGWVRPGERRNTPGNPLTFVTTDVFLTHFSLSSLSELPGHGEIRSMAALADLSAPPALASPDIQQEP